MLGCSIYTSDDHAPHEVSSEVLARFNNLSLVAYRFADAKCGQDICDGEAQQVTSKMLPRTYSPGKAECFDGVRHIVIDPSVFCQPATGVK